MSSLVPIGTNSTPTKSSLGPEYKPKALRIFEPHMRATSYRRDIARDIGRHFARHFARDKPRDIARDIGRDFARHIRLREI